MEPMEQDYRLCTSFNMRGELPAQPKHRVFLVTKGKLHQVAHSVSHAE